LDVVTLTHSQPLIYQKWSPVRRNFEVARATTEEIRPTATGSLIKLNLRFLTTQSKSVIVCHTVQ
jgi:hypothetical protein